MPSLPKHAYKPPWITSGPTHENRKNWAHNQKFYHGKAWKDVRQLVLQRDPLCIDCQSKGIIKQSTVVDHIHPISQGGSPLDPANLQGLCKACHDIKSANDRWEKDVPQPNNEG